MRRLETFIAAGTLLSVAVAGCGPDATTPEHSTTPPITSVEHSQGPEVDLGILPDTLPQAVANDAGAIVAMANLEEPTIKKDAYGVTETQYPDQHDASGERIGPDLYLTAGHLLMDSANQPLPDSTKCGTLHISAPTTESYALGSDSGGNNERLYGITLDAQKATGSYTYGDEGSIPDIALLQMTAPHDESIPTPSIPISSTALYIGEMVFMLGYAPDSKGTLRNPDQTQLSATEIPAGYDKPDIYGGVIVGFQRNGDPFIAENLKSYSTPPQAVTLSGQSGGAVVTDNGELVGETIESYGSPTTAFDGSALDDTFDIDAHRVPNNKTNVSIAQHITPKLITNLQQTLQATASCTN